MRPNGTEGLIVMTELHFTCPLLKKNSNCPCRRLLNQWNVDDPPKLVCLETLQHSVRQWADEQAAEVFQSITTSSVGLRPVSMRALASAKPRLARSLSELSEVVEDEHLLERWPFPLGDKYLAIVVRQWIQEEPSKTFANLLLNHPFWAETTTMFRELWERSTKGGGADPTRNASRLFDNVKDLLAQIQVPTSPANIAFTVGRIISGEDIELLPTPHRHLIIAHQSDGQLLPARGVLLTTQIFASLSLLEDDTQSPKEASVVWLVQPDARLALSGDLAHVSGPFIQTDLANAILAHRDFARSLAQHPFTEISAIRKAQPGSFKSTLADDECHFDYIAEARREAQSRRDVLIQNDVEWKIDRDVKKILDRTQKRVAQRRRRAGLEGTPPRRWRLEAERLIRQDLEI